MSGRAAPRVLTLPPGVPFLETVADSLLSGDLVPGFRPDSADPLALADATIYVPTRRAARALRLVFLERLGGRAALLPRVRPLGEVDEDADAFATADALALAPPIPAIDRLLLLAPLVQGWKRHLPAAAARRLGEEVVVPASLSDALWLARDLADLMDEVDMAGASWSPLATLVPEELAEWWQVTLEFLRIVAEHWPAALAERGQSSPAAHRAALIDAETERLRARPAGGPVVAAGSTGSIPATARLLAAIARLPNGAVVLPGLDASMDDADWARIGDMPAPGTPHGSAMSAATFGHPQAGLKRLLAVMGVARGEVETLAEPARGIAARTALLAQALRPAETTEAWIAARSAWSDEEIEAALDGVTLVEAGNEREEAVAIAAALRMAIRREGDHAALVTGDRELARRVVIELRRFGVEADDSGGSPLATALPATLAALLVRCVFQPGDAVDLVNLIKHPLLRLGLPAEDARATAETVDLVCFRGGWGRPDVLHLALLFDDRLATIDANPRKPFWRRRLDPIAIDAARAALARLAEALAPLAALRESAETELAEIATCTVAAVEAVCRESDGGLARLYEGDAGDAYAAFFRSVLAADVPFSVPPGDWPALLEALWSGEIVKPSASGDSRISIWGPLEARLQDVGILVVGGLNEGSWPRQAQADRFMSRPMKMGLTLDPPERRIGQSAHDFVMAMGQPNVILTRAARQGDAPSTPSRWLRRLDTLVGENALAAARRRGNHLLTLAGALDDAPRVSFAARPQPSPPLDLRPSAFSVTEIETLRRDAYAVHARRILRLEPLEPLLRDPSAADRGNLFHDIAHAFVARGIDPRGPDALGGLLEIGREEFAALGLPRDVEALWWPRFAHMAENFVAWERGRAEGIQRRVSEIRAAATPVGATGITLSGRADRIDLRPAGMADILDYKTGSGPSKGQAHTLLSPQLALEAGLLIHGAFGELGKLEPADLVYVRLRPNGDVIEESILEYKRQARSAPDLAGDAWARLEAMLAHYLLPGSTYLSRALPWREGDVSGHYDHLARVLEWSSGPDAEAE